VRQRYAEEAPFWTADDAFFVPPRRAAAAPHCGRRGPLLGGAMAHGVAHGSSQHL
jgi:hypothetical protein